MILTIADRVPKEGSVPMTNHIVSRFWAKVEKNGPIASPTLGRCWIWKFGTDAAGYGRVGFQGANQKASRVAWFLKHKRWPDPCALHKCDNRRCVRPSHLFEGSRAQNIADMNQKNRGRPARGAANGRAKLTDLQVIHIREAASQNELGSHLARQYDVSEAVISSIVLRKNWKHI